MLSAACDFRVRNRLRVVWRLLRDCGLMDARLWVVVACVVVMYTPVAYQLKCGPDEEQLNGQRCCTKCAPGSGVYMPCSPENDTVCHACTPGKTFSDRHGHLALCQPCRSCAVGSHVVTSCNITHNTVCECDVGFFRDRIAGDCHPCRQCAPGYGVTRACTASHDTTCSRCPIGSFSDTTNSRQRCIKCSVCDSRQVALQTCNANQDTICMSLTLPVPPAREHMPIDGRSKVVTSQTSIMPLYCSLLAAVVIGLCLYAFVKQRASRRHGNATLAYVAVETAGNKILLPPSGKQHESDSGVSLEPEVRAVTGDMRVRDLPATKRKALEKLLSCDTDDDDAGNWKSLAKQLGFSATRVASFESRAALAGHAAVRHVLTEWSRCRGATVSALVAALEEIGRRDVIVELYGSFISPARREHEKKSKVSKAKLKVTETPISAVIAKSDRPRRL